MPADEESRGGKSGSKRKTNTRQKVSHASASTTNKTASGSAGKRRSQPPAAMNIGQAQLEDELLTMDFQSMYNDMGGIAAPVITPNWTFAPPPSSAEVWRPLKKLAKKIQPQDRSRPPRHPQQEKCLLLTSLMRC